MRVKLTIEYDGRGLVGWQRQDNGPSVQAALEDAVMKLEPEHRAVYGAGRTDAGVHARAMVAHVDITRDMAAEKLAPALNYHLRPRPISVLHSEEVPGDFHARFSATKRHYRYQIINRRGPLALEAGLAWLVPHPLDAEAMHDAAQRLVGRHDFTTFRHAHCQAKDPVKTLDYLRVGRLGERILVETGARSFLHHQVRSMVGCLALVGQGRWSADDLKAAHDAADRSRLGLNAPPDGLYFTGVDYPDTLAAK
ncbi:MAG: tRNA pseudouridine(38-40) synthase TruA [Pseudomonadota bacterium]